MRLSFRYSSLTGLRRNFVENNNVDPMYMIFLKNEMNALILGWVDPLGYQVFLRKNGVWK